MVVVVGSFVQDLTWQCAAFPRAGETVIGAFATGPGGKGSNQAVAAARAGARTRFIGAVGRDAFGAGAKTFHRAEGIATRLILKPRHATGTAAILVEATGQNEIIVALGANAALAPRDVPAPLLRGARVVVTQHESDPRLIAHVLRAGHRAGAITVHNPAPMRPDFDPAWLAHVTVLIPNESEFAALVNQLATHPRTDSTVPATGASQPPLSAATIADLPDAALHAWCRATGVPVVIVTLGARGAVVSQATGFTRLPAHVVEAVDTTGAGDAFVGAFAAALAEASFSPEAVLAAARFAMAAAALSVTRRGTAPAMPHRAEIKRLLAARPRRRPGSRG